ncbi:MAG TPA: hypothetical protein VFP81_07165 [Propionibacteriaceae bacterium]|nr:hypothetical protein [Propionibacteriaceae bacterium]
MLVARGDVSRSTTGSIASFQPAETLFEPARLDQCPSPDRCGEGDQVGLTMSRPHVSGAGQELGSSLVVVASSNQEVGIGEEKPSVVDIRHAAPHLRCPASGPRELRVDDQGLEEPER